MLHRLALRVLPRLSLSVTAESVRKRKRWVMLAPGLAAFVFYRILKLVTPLSDPVILLAVSGVVSAITAGWAYRMGRGTTLAAIWREDGSRTVGWLIGWVGFVYGVQLSLMVLALLNVIVHYDFLVHPDGPGMMAILIACTSVARDAFEIGHVRRLQQQGQAVITFPDGAPLRTLFADHPWVLARWSLVAGLSGALVALGFAQLGSLGRSDLGQLLVVSLFAGTLSVCAYLAGEHRTGGLVTKLASVGWASLLRLWWWPGLTFAATYHLTLTGAIVFLFRVEGIGVAGQSLMAAAVTALMAIDCYYLGYRRSVENRIHETVPSSLLRCPFVMGILSKSGATPAKEASEPSEVVLRETGGRG